MMMRYSFHGFLPRKSPISFQVSWKSIPAEGIQDSRPVRSGRGWPMDVHPKTAIRSKSAELFNHQPGKLGHSIIVIVISMINDVQ